MSRYQGDILVGATIRFPFNTIDSTGAPITLAGTPTVRVYKDDGTTEDDSGITLNVDFDSRTGLHLIEIDTSADGTFYSTGANFFAVLTAGTVGGVSVVGQVVGSFSIANRPVNVEQVAGQTATPDATLVDDIANAVAANADAGSVSGTVEASPAPSTSSIDVNIGADRASGFFTRSWAGILDGSGAAQWRRVTTHTRVSATVARLAFSGSAGTPDAALATAPASGDTVKLTGRG